MSVTVVVIERPPAEVPEMNRGSQFLAAELLVETGDAAIIEAAGSLRGTTLDETVANIHAFVENLPAGGKPAVADTEVTAAATSPMDVSEPTAYGALKTLNEGTHSPVD